MQTFFLPKLQLLLHPPCEVVGKCPASYYKVAIFATKYVRGGIEQKRPVLHVLPPKSPPLLGMETLHRALMPCYTRSEIRVVVFL